MAPDALGRDHRRVLVLRAPDRVGERAGPSVERLQDAASQTRLDERDPPGAPEDVARNLAPDDEACDLVPRHDGRTRRGTRQERELTEDLAGTRLIHETATHPDLNMAGVNDVQRRCGGTSFPKDRRTRGKPFDRCPRCHLMAAMGRKGVERRRRAEHLCEIDVGGCRGSGIDQGASLPQAACPEAKPLS